MEMKLAENIKAFRKARNMTQEQLAESLGVTVGAVYKWETDRSVPEITLLITLAQFFEVSVDALLGYGWEKLDMGQTAERLHQYVVDKQLEEGMRYAEQAIQKYPNSFRVVLESAHIYFLTMDPKHAARAAELYKRAIQLIDQNTDEKVNATTLQNQVAACYCYMDRMDEAIEILKKNNVDGMNNYRIGLLLSQNEEKAEESLKYLSDALGDCYSQLYNICIGYANAYGILEELDKTRDLVLWMYALGRGLRETDAVTWMDRGDVRLFTILAELDFLQGNEQGAYDWLVRARDSARRFDAAPEYHTGAGLKFYHGSKQAISYDDMGQTAIAMIENFMADDVAGKNLRPIWAEICQETNQGTVE